MSILPKAFSLLSCLTLVFTTIPLGAPPAAAQEQYAPLSADDMDAMVAPIALYPDELIAQVLGAASYPEQVVEANDWLQANPGLQGQALMQAADQQTWDDAVKAITLFPSVVKLLADNLAWTSALGELAGVVHLACAPQLLNGDWPGGGTCSTSWTIQWWCSSSL